MTRPCFQVAAGLFVLAHAGCGDAPVVEPDPPVAALTGIQTITIRVPEMGERLKLM